MGGDVLDLASAPIEQGSFAVAMNLAEIDVLFVEENTRRGRGAPEESRGFGRGYSPDGRGGMYFFFRRIVQCFRWVD